MRYLRLAETDRLESLRKAVEVVRSGGIVLYPTDTIYGLGCDQFNALRLQQCLYGVRVDILAKLQVEKSPRGATHDLGTEEIGGSRRCKHCLYPECRR